MLVWDEIVDDITNKFVPNVINGLRKFTIELEEEHNATFNSIDKDIERFRETGVLTLQDVVIPSTNENRTTAEKSLQEDPVPGHQRYTRRNHAQEDVLSDIKNVVSDHNKQRSVRTVIERATNDLSTMSTNNVVVKQEMPPPTKRPLRDKRRGNTQLSIPDSEVKEAALDCSVILVPKASVDVIVLDDSHENVRVTRARTKRKINREESERLPEISRKTIKVERTTKRKNNEAGLLEISPQKKKIMGNDTDSLPAKKKAKLTNVKQSLSTAELSGADSSEGETAAFPRQTRMKREFEKQIPKEKTNFREDEAGSSPIKKKRARGKKTITNEIKDPGFTSDEDQERSHAQETSEKNAETNSDEGETLASSQKALSNETVCVVNPTFLNEKLPNETMVITKPTTIDDLMTDDEDFVPASPSPIRHVKGNQMFSPYESSPVKKRVQAFEKLETKNAEISSLTRSKPKVFPTPKTRTQIEVFEKLNAMNATVTRSKAKLETKGPPMSSSTPKTKIPKLFSTPVTNSKLRSGQTSSAYKVSSHTTNVKHVTLTTDKTGSALKASIMEYREREQRRLQKEQEAIQKKEALLQSKAEEKRRKREERELKVQQVKANKDKEKQRQLLSAEIIKEEKYKQMLAEKEAKFIKQKEEAAQKRAAALKKAEEKKNQVPLDEEMPYFAYPTPLLPAPDCYDSDDSSARATIVIPPFQQKQALKETLCEIENLYAYQKDLFTCSSEAPNLREIFPGIHASKLKRTSSGIWNKTERSILESMFEEDES